MKRSEVVFLQTVLVLIGVAAMALLLWQPQVEGVNKNKTNFEIYFQDPFLALAYTGSVPFFVALYQAIRALGHVGRNQVFSPEVVASLRIIRYCALVVIGFVFVEEIVILFMTDRDGDNPGAPIFLGMLIVFPAVVVVAVAGMMERILQKAVDMKSESELTV